jgi:hypothetical protein
VTDQEEEVTKKNASAVSSWGFSGYIMVLPKEPKPQERKPKVSYPPKEDSRNPKR